MKTILVTGGAGFIGSHLCEMLLQDRDNYVICLDNFSTGSKNNLYFVLKDKHQRRNDRFEIIRHDIIDPIRIEIDQIYHLVCPAPLTHRKFDPIEAIKIDKWGTYNMCGLAKRTKAKLLFTSETCNEGKRCAEIMITKYHNAGHIPNIGIARIFNTYGPYMAVDEIISNFIISALKNEPLLMHRSGNQTKSFCYVSDIVKGLIKLMSHENFLGPVNIGNPYTEIKVDQLAKKISKFVNKSHKTKMIDQPIDVPNKRKPDISLAKEKLNWEPVVSLEDGLHETIDFFKTALYQS